MPRQHAPGFSRGAAGSFGLFDCNGRYCQKTNGEHVQCSPLLSYEVATMSGRKRIGCPAAIWGDPLVRALGSLRQFELTRLSPADSALGLREGRLDAALVSMIDYAREGSLHRIVPGVAVSSRGASNAVVLHFREGIHTITTLAADPRSASDIILATILLAEEFDVVPSIVPVERTGTEHLSRADAVLITGDEALRDAMSRNMTLDLVEAWSEMTDRPYVHAILCCREHALSDEELRLLGALAPVYSDEEPADAAGSAIAHGLPSRVADTLGSYLSSFTYGLTDEVREGLSEFLTYAFYHGILPDVPDLHFYSTADDAASESTMS